MNHKISIPKRSRAGLILRVSGLFIVVLLSSLLGYKFVKGNFQQKSVADPQSKIESVPTVSQDNKNIHLPSSEGFSNSDSKKGEDSENVDYSSPTNVIPSTKYVPSTYTPAPANSNVAPTTNSDSNGYDPNYCTDLWNTRKQALAPTQAEITETQNKIYSLMSDIRARTSGSFVTEAQVQRLYTQEKAVLDSKLNSLKNELNRIKEQFPVC